MPFFSRPWNARLRVCAVLGLIWAGAAGAAEFTLNPTRVHLSRGHTVETLLLGNGEARPLTFEAEVKRWYQGPDGKWRLEPSDDLVVHPLIVTIPAGGKVRLRVGTLSAQTDVERDYRVELQQLPDPKPAEGASITLLTRLSVPVFVQPVKREVRAALVDARVESDAVRVQLGNVGNVYLPPQQAVLRLLDARGAVLREESIETGYVLPNARLPLSRPLPGGLCPRVARVELALRETAKTLAADLAASARRCAR